MIPISRTIVPASVNINRLISEISVMPKYNAVTRYDPTSGDIEIEVDDGWLTADDNTLDLIISNHVDTPLPIIPKAIPFSVAFAGGASSHIARAGTVLEVRAHFIYPGSLLVGKHTRCLIAWTGDGTGDTRIVLTDNTNSVEIFNFQQLRVASGVYEVAEIILPVMPEGEVLMQVELGSGNGGTDGELSSILFLG